MSEWSRKATIGIPAVLIAGALLVTVAWPVLDPRAEDLSIVYPFDGSVFPPEIVSPTLWWDDVSPHADRWRVTISFDDGGSNVRADVDDRYWTPDAQLWESIKERTVESGATVEIASVKSVLGVGLTISRDAVSISTSRDSVGAPIYYRDVPLPFRFALRNLPMIRWRLGEISSYEPPPVVLDNLPVCGNCHSFSSDGQHLGMDANLGSDRGAYALTTFEEETVLSKDKLIAWSDYVRGEKVPTFGMLPSVSPSGRFVLAGVKDRAVFLPREDILFSQIFFPVMGILAYYDRTTGQIEALPGADDETLVQSNGVWSPDGEYVLFARAPAAELSAEARTEDIILTLEESAEVLGGVEFLARAREGGKRFRFDLYRVPFNEGRGGEPEPIPGAHDNGMSNFFPKVSPDGKWIVFTQAHSFMLLQPDSKLYIMPAEGGEPRLMNANTDQMNSWHSWSPNSRWLVFSTKAFGPYTQLMLTHIDENGMDSPPVWLRNFTAADRAANIPEFVNISPQETRVIQEAFIDDYSYFRSGRIYEQLHEYDRAQRDFQRSLELNPENTFALYSLATISRGEGDNQAAREAYEAILDVDPGSSVVHGDLGILLFEMGEIEAAEAEFRTAARLDPENIEAGLNLGRILLNQERVDEAERALDRLLQFDLPFEAAQRVYESLATIHLMRGNYPQAANALRAVVRANYDNVAAHRNLGLAYRALNDLESAKEQFDIVIRLDPNDPMPHGQLGEIYEAEGNTSLALQEFHKVVDLDPGNLAGLMQMARLYYETRDFESARDALTHVLSIESDNVWAIVSLGRVYYETGRFDWAARQFRQLLVMTPNDARVWFMLGEALIREGRSLTEPIEAYQRGLALEPDYVEGHATLGDLYVSAGDLPGAIREFQAALELSGDNPTLADDLRARIADLQRRVGE